MRYMQIYLILLVALLCGGCSTTYVPISWDYGDKVKALSNTDTTLKIFYSKYDPQRQTLRVRGTSFAEVMMPYEVKYHLGAYRPDTKILYRNLYRKYSDKELRDVMVHEFAHHIWFIHMSHDQREKWRQYLAKNPSPAQTMARNGYDEKDYDKEDFAFVLQFPRRIDIEELATLKIITEEERDAILKEMFPPPKPVITAKAPAKGSAAAPATGAKTDPAKAAPGTEGAAKVPAGDAAAKAPAGAVGDAAAKVDAAARTSAAEGASGTAASGTAPAPAADTVVKSDPAAKAAAALESASPEKAAPAAATADAAATTAKTAPSTEGLSAAKAPATGAAPAATEAAKVDQKVTAPAIMEEAPAVKIPPAADAPPAAIAETIEKVQPAVKASAADGVPANAAASAEDPPTPATVLFISDDPAKTAAPHSGTTHQ